ncbi:MAG TPA: glycosyltransferase [Lacipirellulaceae bacterium]|nr:glycosyltransferase [Lacipirellulaceae bacterium]
MPSVSRAAGGIFEVERRLAQQIAAMDQIEVQAFGTQDEFTQEDADAWKPVEVRTFPTRGPRAFGWSPALKQAFDDNSADVGHLHVLWMHTSIIMRSWSRHHRKPYLTTLHGMLDPWALRNSRWKKELSAVLYERSCLNEAACVQTFSRSELRSAREFGLNNPICVIPNGIDIPQLCGVPAPWEVNGKKTLLYLGRLHPKKGLVNLLGAWRKLRTASHTGLENWQLAIAGWSQGGHEAELKELTAAYGIQSEVKFLGPLYGDVKAGAYCGAEAVVLPSFSEGLPMAVLEAWAYRKPVLLTPQCNLPEGAAIGAAIEVAPEVDTLAEGLASLIEASDAERAQMGERGWELVNQKFTWPKVAAEMLSVYGWLVGGGPAPASVQLS